MMRGTIYHACLVFFIISSVVCGTISHCSQRVYESISVHCSDVSAPHCAGRYAKEWNATSQDSAKEWHYNLDLLAYSTVVDLRCINPWWHAYWHQHVECFVGQSALLATLPGHLNSKTTLFLVDASLHEWLLSRINHHTAIRVPQLEYVPNPATVRGLRANNTAIRARSFITFSDSYWKTHGTDLSEIFHCARETHALPETRQQQRAGIVMLQRKGRGRDIPTRTELWQALQTSFPEYTLMVLDGSECAQRTRDVLSQARVIVAGHGAGIVNVLLYAPSDSLMIEITRDSLRNAGTIWRQNSYILGHVGITVHYEVIPAETTVAYLLQSHDTVMQYVDNSRQKLVKPDIELHGLRDNFTAACDYILTLVPDEKSLPFVVSKIHIQSIVDVIRRFVI